MNNNYSIINNEINFFEVLIKIWIGKIKIIILTIISILIGHAAYHESKLLEKKNKLA